MDPLLAARCRGVLGGVATAVKTPTTSRFGKSAPIVKKSKVTAVDVPVETSADLDTSRPTQPASPPSASPVRRIFLFASTVEELKLGSSDIAIQYAFDGIMFGKVKYVSKHALTSCGKPPNGHISGDDIYIETVEGYRRSLLNWIWSKGRKYKAWRKHVCWCKADGVLR